MSHFLSVFIACTISHTKAETKQKNDPEAKGDEGNIWISEGSQKFQ